MTAREQIIAADRFRRALLMLQTAGWADPEHRVKEDIRAAAVAAIEAYEAFTAAGLVAGAADRRLIGQAQQYLAKGRQDPAS
ncbi:hypothetical protein JMJ56_32460 [Belnapia sp. T18]|uniref:Uncharacterized protein n=1 Tax=Belnapia arida TaxID=2804533 RepID=A0ABS1UDD5_9PROT|nr:hypothetical protein [Belnapia arida]MBL6082678.1 hypothetical protein [Belnapia arida]